MSYSVASDLEKQIPEEYLIELTDDEETGSVDDAIIDRAIADADSEIDLYCGTRYTVPFSPVPEIIRKFSVDVAAYNLYGRRRNTPAEVKERYTKIIASLEFVRDGTLDISGETETGPDSSAIDVQPTFTRGKHDEDGTLLGNVMGKENKDPGSLDDW